VTAKPSTTPSSANLAKTGSKGANLQLEVELGSILIAQSSFTKKASLHVDIRSGDKIKVIKYVSGITYLGENLRTNLSGHFPTSVFQKQVPKKNSLIEQQRAIAGAKTATLMRNTHERSSSSDNSLDDVEGMNAAEWDTDETSVATAPERSSVQELTGKDSVVATLVKQSHDSELNQEDIMREMMSRMIDEKV
jgi:hypothetical protein